MILMSPHATSCQHRFDYAQDGPSAGVTLATALASLYTERPARADTAMTGELTLRGLVLPVGGVKDKLLAAHQAGASEIIFFLKLSLRIFMVLTEGCLEVASGWLFAAHQAGGRTNGSHCRLAAGLLRGLAPAIITRGLFAKGSCLMPPHGGADSAFGKVSTRECHELLWVRRPNGPAPPGGWPTSLWPPALQTRSHSDSAQQGVQAKATACA